MARVKGPLFSFAASGNTTGGAMQFRTTKAGTHVYQPPDPDTQNQGPPTPEQETQRLRFKEACDEWSALDAPAKTQWAVRGEAFNLSGFSLFMREKLNLKGT